MAVRAAVFRAAMSQSIGAWEWSCPWGVASRERLVGHCRCRMVDMMDQLGSYISAGLFLCSSGLGRIVAQQLAALTKIQRRGIRCTKVSTKIKDRVCRRVGSLLHSHFPLNNQIIPFMHTF